jgi:hypothetical protein
MKSVNWPHENGISKIHSMYLCGILLTCGRYWWLKSHTLNESLTSR